MEHIDRSVDPMDPYRALHYGSYQLDVSAGDRSRKLLVYIPAGFRPAGRGIFVIPDDHVRAADLLKSGEWTRLAGEGETFEQFVVVVLEAEATWNTEEEYGDPNGDVAYIDAAFEVAKQRHLFCIHESKFYLAGFGSGAAIAQMEAMYNPTIWSGLVAVGDCGVLADYQKKAAADYADNLGWFVDASHRRGIRKGQIPMPVWLIGNSGAESNTLEYWKTANGIDSSESPVRNSEGVSCFRSRHLSQPDSVNRDREAYVVQVSTTQNHSMKLAEEELEKIKDFLFHHQRWMGGAGGDLRLSHHFTNENGWSYHYKKVGNWMREWITHFPKCVKKHPNKKVPVVFAMHGYTNTCFDYAGHSEWFRVADKYGFIVVHPSAVPGNLFVKNDFCDPENEPLPAWNYSHEAVPNGPDEIEFFRYMLDNLIAQGCVDQERVYITGHSHGSQMTHALALEMTKRFAAAAPCSGVLFHALGQYIPDFTEVRLREDCKIPIWMFGGSEEEFLLSKDPSDENETGQSILYWCKTNHISPPKNWTAGWKTKDERWHDFFVRTEQGAPMVGFTWLDYMPHATTPEMSFRIWEDFFCHYKRVGSDIEWIP